MNANEAKKLTSDRRRQVIEGEMAVIIETIREAATKGVPMCTIQGLRDPGVLYFLKEELQYLGYDVTEVGGHTVSLLIKWEGAPTT